MIVYLAIYGLIFIQYTLVHSIDFSQCGLSMKCFVDWSCRDIKKQLPSKIVDYTYMDSLVTPGTCNRTVSIKTLSAFRWQFTLVDKSLKPGNGVKLEWNKQAIVTCNSSGIDSEFNKSIIRLTDTSDSSARATNCSFIIESSEELLLHLEKEFPLTVDRKLSLPNSRKILHHNHIPLEHYEDVVDLMKCDISTEQLHYADCPSEEECAELNEIPDNGYKCPKDYFMRYRDGDGKWENSDLLKRTYCSFFVDNSSVALPSTARVKCSRKRCSLCNPTLSSTQWDEPCFKHKCPDTHKMLVHGQLNPSNLLKCSAESNATSAVFSYNSTHVHLADIKCVKKSDCAAISPSTVFECPDDADDCLKPNFENNKHSCPPTHHLFVQSKGQDAEEGTAATCNTNTGQWMIGEEVIEDSLVYCIKKKDQETTSVPMTSSTRQDLSSAGSIPDVDQSVTNDIRPSSTTTQSTSTYPDESSSLADGNATSVPVSSSTHHPISTTESHPVVYGHMAENEVTTDIRLSSTTSTTQSVSTNADDESSSLADRNGEKQQAQDDDAYFSLLHDE